MPYATTYLKYNYNLMKQIAKYFILAFIHWARPVFFATIFITSNESITEIFKKSDFCKNLG